MVRLMRQSMRRVEVAVFLLGPQVLVGLRLALRVVVNDPVGTFQCPPSPSGTVQPVKSLPLKGAVKPAGAATNSLRQKQ